MKMGKIPQPPHAKKFIENFYYLGWGLWAKNAIIRHLFLSHYKEFAWITSRS
ncbi:hypothetical protein GCWU000324_00450 [Kingella oralis ATCC 51147]|uniref:Uncharacterized protein n=1 Tax=Kingella oralis ATCC 51147 TaxID=629741 RepID=C4GHW2_9NEIS|nr:hypothetical protein GCWU000324_00450 [Kingella oralis ATCC 51147]